MRYRRGQTTTTDRQTYQRLDLTVGQQANANDSMVCERRASWAISGDNVKAVAPRLSGLSGTAACAIV